MSTDFESRIRAIEERNLRVEGDKAWEISTVRRTFLTIVTYIVAYAAFFAMDNANPAANAVIPSGGYLLSTLSLPLLKVWWLRSRNRG